MGIFPFSDTRLTRSAEAGDGTCSVTVAIFRGRSSSLFALFGERALFITRTIVLGRDLLPRQAHHFHHHGEEKEEGDGGRAS